MFDVTEDGRYKLPNGIPVTARRTVLPGLAWELRGPGGWGRWAIDSGGVILGLGPTIRKQPSVRPTGWSMADLTPDGDGVLAGVPAGSTSGSR